MHWTERYIGQPYGPGNTGCVALCRQVQAEVFGREILLPEMDGNIRDAARVAELLTADYGTPTIAPEDGDAVVMRCGERLWHVGVFVLAPPNTLASLGNAFWPYVLHATRSHGQAHMTRTIDLPRQGLHVEGYYRWAVKEVSHGVA